MQSALLRTWQTFFPRTLYVYVCICIAMMCAALLMNSQSKYDSRSEFFSFIPNVYSFKTKIANVYVAELFRSGQHFSWRPEATRWYERSNDEKEISLFKNLRNGTAQRKVQSLSYSPQSLCSNILFTLTFNEYLMSRPKFCWLYESRAIRRDWANRQAHESSSILSTHKIAEQRALMIKWTCQYVVNRI